MLNFYEYIKKDIDEKKTLLSVFPSNTKARAKKYIETINEIKSKYSSSLDDIKKFIDYKYEKLMPVKMKYDLTNELEEMYRIKKYLIVCNPRTSYYEQLEIDMIIQDLMHYYKNSIKKDNEIILKLVDKFKEINVELSEKDFAVNPYCKLYMSYFFKTINGDDTIESSHFEKIYWKVPQVFEYIIVCFRLLITKNSNKFKNLVKKKTEEILTNNSFKNYDDIVKRYKYLINKVNNIYDEDEYDIVNRCMNKEIDINTIMNEEKKVYDFEFFMIDKFNLDDTEKLKDYVANIISLKMCISEYKKYLVLENIIKNFKKENASLIEGDKAKNNKAKKDNSLEKNLSTMLKNMSKLTISIKSDRIDELEAKLTVKDNDKLFKQNELIKDIYELYKSIDNKEYEDNKKKIIRDNITVAEVFEFINSYPFFEKEFIEKNMPDITKDEIDDYIKDIYNMIYNPYRKIIDMIHVFSNEDINRVLTNGFRFQQVNVIEDTFSSENIDEAYNRCEQIIRRTKFNDFKLSLEEIKFLVDVYNLKQTNKY